MEEETWLTPELLMISKQSEHGWKNCAVSARGQMLRERNVGRFSRRVETRVIYWPLDFIEGIGRSRRNCAQIQRLVFRKTSWTGSGNEPVTLGLMNLLAAIPYALHSSTPRTVANLPVIYSPPSAAYPPSVASETSLLTPPAPPPCGARQKRWLHTRLGSSLLPNNRASSPSSQRCWNRPCRPTACGLRRVPPRHVRPRP
jgi:hypothetical protein